MESAPPAEASDVSPPRPRKPRSEEIPKPYKPAALPKGKRPPKSPKTERTPMKPGAKPKPKSHAAAGEEQRAPRTKPVWKKENRDAARTERPAREGTPSDKWGEKPNGKSFGKGKDRADQRPGGKADFKSGGKPAHKSAGKPEAKTGGRPEALRDDSAAKKRAADPSKRFVPPHKRGKPGAKGPNATPKRKP
jgi:ATP-dependent RNA helicase DeaD